MKSNIGFFLVFAVFLFGLSACSGEDIDKKPRVGFEGAIYEEGVHYKDLGSRIEMLNSDVTTFFWFQCPHCNNIRSPLSTWLSENPDVSSQKIHSLISEAWVQDQMLYQALKKRGIFEESFDPIFDHIHGDGQSQKGILDILEDSGINAEKEIFDFSKEEKEEMMRNVKKITEMEKRIGATGVPYIVVDGKFLLKNSSFSSYEEMMHAVGWILENK